MKGIAALFFVIVLIGLGVWFAMNSPVSFTLPNLTASSTPATMGSASSTASSTAHTRTLPAGYQEFRSQPYHFSIFYPDTLSIRDQSGGGGGPFTLVLANSDASQALQVYVQPYTLPTITPTRFKLDAPYAKTTNPTNIEVLGAKGLEFVGSSAGNPDMLEIWFIHEGLLYEVTAPASLKSWAEDIVQTWEFVN
jgi:hypothetical protein